MSFAHFELTLKPLQNTEVFGGLVIASILASIPQLWIPELEYVVKLILYYDIDYRFGLSKMPTRNAIHPSSDIIYFHLLLRILVSGPKRV